MIAWDTLLYLYSYSLWSLLAYFGAWCLVRIRKALHECIDTKKLIYNIGLLDRDVHPIPSNLKLNKGIIKASKAKRTCDHLNPGRSVPIPPRRAISPDAQYLYCAQGCSPALLSSACLHSAHCHLNASGPSQPPRPDSETLRPDDQCEAQELELLHGRTAS